MKYHGQPLAKRVFFVQWHREGWGGASSVTDNTSKSDIKLGKEDDLTEMPICPCGRRTRDLRGSQDVLGKCMDKEPFSRVFQCASWTCLLLGRWPSPKPLFVPGPPRWTLVVLSPVNMSIPFKPIYNLWHLQFYGTASAPPDTPCKEILPCGFAAAQHPPGRLLGCPPGGMEHKQEPCSTHLHQPLSQAFTVWQFITDLILLISETGSNKNIQSLFAYPAPNLGKAG